MSAILNGSNSVNRLIETLAGSAVLLSNPAGATSILPSSLNPVHGEAGADGSANAEASASSDQSNASFDLTPLASSGNVGTGTGAIVDSIAAAANGLGGNGNVLGDLPIVGDGGSPGSLPAVGGLTGNTDDLLTLAGPDGTLQPVFDPLNATIKDVHVALETLSHQVGLSDLIHSVTYLGETIGLGEIGNDNNLVTDVVNLPGAIVGGNLDQAISNIGNDLTDIVHHVGDVAEAALLDADDPSNPIPDIIQAVGGDLQSTPLLTIGGGNTGSTPLGATLGDISHSSSGHLIDIDIGPQQSSGLPIDVLAANQPGPYHTVEINAVDVGPNGPHLADVGVLTGGQLFNCGSDSLVGNVLGNVGGNCSPVEAVTQAADVHDLLPAIAAMDHGPLDLHGTHII